jgi:DNA polymerase III epsilon subunit-like protein
MKKFLFIDTETNGLPADYTKPGTDTDNWPRCIQLAYALTTAESPKDSIKCGDWIIKPDCWTIPENITALTGISMERAEEQGVPIAYALDTFAYVYSQADYIVAHNLEFDWPVLTAEYIRLGLEVPTGAIEICTMKAPEVINFCALPASSAQRYRGQKYKWPKLQELHKKLFDHEFEGAHDAMRDMASLTYCFFELVELGVLAI